jgi:hypothetical protein
MLHDNLSKAMIEQAAGPENRTATLTGDTIDMAGCGACFFVFCIGVSADTLSGSVYWTCSLTESAISDSAFGDVADADIIGPTTNDVVIDSDTEDDACYVIGYKGSKRYVRPVITMTGSHGSGTPLSIIAIKGHLATAPSATLPTAPA